MSSAPERRVSKGSAPADPPPASPAQNTADDPTETVPPPPAPGPPAEEPAADPTEILAGELRQALADLTKRLERDDDRAAHRETVIDRLHEENQRLRRGELDAAFNPVRAALYRVHDLARREAERWAAPEPPPAGNAAALLGALADEIADALGRTGVERFTVEPGAPYDPARHRPVAVAPVDDPADAGTVVAVRTDGFERDGRVVRKAEVSVGKAPPGGDGHEERVDDGTH